MKLTKSLAAAAVAMALSTSAFASTFNEIADAGDMFATAQAVTNGTTQIVGNLSGVNDVDMFKFSVPLTGFTGFTTFSLVASGVSDTILTLVDSNNVILAYNDDIDLGAGNLASVTFNFLAGGQYGIAVTNYANFPTPLSVGETLTGWSNNGFSGNYGNGNYQITVLGQGSVAAPIPEPEIYAMMAAGLGLMGFVARRRQRNGAAV